MVAKLGGATLGFAGGGDDVVGNAEQEDDFTRLVGGSVSSREQATVTIGSANARNVSGPPVCPLA